MAEKLLHGSEIAAGAVKDALSPGVPRLVHPLAAGDAGGGDPGLLQASVPPIAGAVSALLNEVDGNGDGVYDPHLYQVPDTAVTTTQDTNCDSGWMNEYRAMTNAQYDLGEDSATYQQAYSDYHACLGN